MDAIVNVNPHWGIGYKGKLLVSIPADLRRFRELTLGKTIIYGHKTLETFPDGQPLADRENIILTKNRDFTAGGALICHSTEELKALLKERYTENLYVIGGESIFKLLVPFCTKAYVTFSYTEQQADRFFPNLNNRENWLVTSIEPTLIDAAVPYRFVEYTNSAPLEL